MNTLKSFLKLIILTLTIPAWSMMIEEDYSTIPCDPYWWKENSLYQVEQLVEDLGKDQTVNTLCGDQKNSFFHLAAMMNPDPEVVTYLFDVGFYIEDTNQFGQNVLDVAAINENPDILYTLNSLASPSYSENNNIIEDEQNPGVGIQVSPEVSPQSDSQRDMKWYAGVAVGSNLPFKVHQEGWNYNTTCYPTDDCDTLPITSYLWSYDLEAQGDKRNNTFAEAFAGFHYYDQVRFEFAVGYQYSQLQQNRKDVNRYIDPDLIKPVKKNIPTHMISSNAVSKLEGLTTYNFTFNTYYDFFQSDIVTLYGGAGLGIAYAKINEVHYSTDYKDMTEPSKTYDPALSFHNSRQDADMSDRLPLVQIHVGSDFNPKEKVKFGLKLTFSNLLGTLDYQSYYSLHPMHNADPNFPNYNMLKDIQYFTAMMMFKWQ